MDYYPQQFYLDFIITKSKKSLGFAELICALPSENTSDDFTEKIPHETLFLINTLDPWYGDMFFTFKPRISDSSCLNITDAASSISLNLIRLLVIRCTESVLIMFFTDV